MGNIHAFALAVWCIYKSFKVHTVFVSLDNTYKT